MLSESKRILKNYRLWKLNRKSLIIYLLFLFFQIIEYYFEKKKLRLFTENVQKKLNNNEEV